MGQVRLNMTGEEFKKLIEQKNPDGIVDTLQEVFALFEGIGDDETLVEYVQRTAKEASQPTYDEEDRKITFGV